MTLKFSLPRYILPLTALSVLLFAFPAYAQVDLGLEFADNIGLRADGIHEIVTGFIRSLLGFVGFILFFQILYGGYLYMVHGGKEEAREVAVNTLKHSIIGFFIIMSASSITNFVIEAVVKSSDGYL